MKTIIAGSRNLGIQLVDIEAVISNLGIEVTEIVSGHSGNVDLMGERYAKENNIPIKLFPPDWNDLGKAAGPFRNRLMAKYADVLIAFWDGESRGTMNMIDEAHQRNLKIHVEHI